MEITKAVIFNGEKDLYWVSIPGGRESTAGVAQRALDQVIAKAAVSVSDLSCIIATGMGREYISFANQQLPEFLCLAKGIDFLLPSTRTLLDLGARKSLAMKCRGGRSLKLAASSKCAAGTGTYLKMVANIFKLDPDEMSELSFQSKVNVEIQANCAVFAESEMISLIHGGAKPEDILKGVFQGLASRIYPQLLEVGLDPDVAVVGGFAANKAVLAALEELVGFKILVPENPGIAGALGAALIGQGTRSANS
jgi:(R)-2-hydroxyacyl-CoA dehydratese activating ATPase